MGADETAATLTVQAESNHQNGALGKKTNSAAVTVLPPAVTGVTVSPAGSSVEQGKARQFSADVAVVSGADSRVLWTVAGEKSADTKISQAGLLTVGADETAATLTVKATSVFDAGQSGTAVVTVTKPQPPDIGPDPVYSLTVQAGAGGTITLGAGGSYPAGALIALEAKADAGYEFTGWTSPNGGSFANAASSATTFTMPAQAAAITANFQKKAPSGPVYTTRTLTDASGVRVSGAFTQDAALAVTAQQLHPAGACAVCDDIRARQDRGELIVLFDISLNAGQFQGELTVEIPVGAQYDGQTVLMLHCKNKVLESSAFTVSGGVAKGAFSTLSPYAVVRVPSSGTVITGLPDSYTLLVGQSVRWTPAPAGGVWSCDKDLLKMTQNGDTYTFKALKEGRATATYAVNGVPHTVTITINSATIPQTGSGGRLWLWALPAAALLGCAALVLVKRAGGKKRHE